MASRPPLSPALEAYVAARRREADRIAPDRADALEGIAAAIAARAGAGPVPLTFVCTHNSRRSQLAQAWAGLAAALSGVPGVVARSAGTEATAFEPRAIAALERAGFTAVREGAGANPVVRLEAGPAGPSQRCWSKTLDEVAAPGQIAVMTCSEADAACPAVPGAAHRVALTYRDPKAHDGRPDERAAYDDRCAQIAREMLHLLARAAALAT